MKQYRFSYQINKLAQLELKEDIEFWAHQLSEHALFMSLGLEPPFSKEAAKLHKKWEKLRPKLKDAEVESAISIVSDPAAELRDFKNEVLKEMDRKWIGWLFPSFIEHLRMENELLLSKIGEKATTPNEELAIWVKLMLDHTNFARHLLDPVEEKQIAKVAELQESFSTLYKNLTIPEEHDSVFKLSKQYGKQLDKYFVKSGLGDPGKTKSVIHPVLGEHVVREGKRFLDFLKAYKGQKI
jgi:hypothetical protein